MSIAILVIDGFGIGAMPDAGELRPDDINADTLGSLVRWSRNERDRPLEIPHLAATGLDLLRPDLELKKGGLDVAAVASKAALGYPGADSFAGHQTMMGADMSHVILCPLVERIDELADLVRSHGHKVVQQAPDKPTLIVDDEMIIHDNLEADPGLNWNVSARMDRVTWDELYAVARIVRDYAPVARVIAVGGISEKPLTEYTRPGPPGTYGLDTPATGFYKNRGFQVEHMGAEVNHRHQLPELAAGAGIPVTLIGKAADLLKTETEVTRIPCVDTHETLDRLIDAFAVEDSLTIANIQQTDLAGHQCAPGRYADLVEAVDRRLPVILDAMNEEDRLLITADHGNDPLVDHAFHTREYVPVLTFESGREPVLRAGEPCDSLADIGATVARELGIGALDTGVFRQLWLS